MKKFTFLFLFFLISKTVSSQITLEHVYDSASTPSYASQLMMVDFEVSGFKYVRVNRQVNQVHIYNIDHSLFKAIQIPPFPTFGTYNYQVMYLSQHLFDLDDDIEFLFALSNPTPPSIPLHYDTYVFDENGLTQFHEENETPVVMGIWHMQQFPIYNTPTGTKLILSDIDTKQGKVYSLPGTLTTAMILPNSDGNASVFSMYPNPANQEVNVEFPFENLKSDGLLVLYDSNGVEINSFELSSGQASFVFSVQGLASGTYFVSVLANNSTYQTQKLLLVD